MEVIPEHQAPYGEGHDGSNQDSASRDILSLSDQFPVLERDFIGKKFQGRVKCLAQPDQADTKENGYPLPASQMDDYADNHHPDRGRRVKAGMRLRGNQQLTSSECMADAAEACGEVVADHGE